MDADKKAKSLPRCAATKLTELPFLPSFPSSSCYSTRSSLDWRPFLSRDTSRLFRSDWRRRRKWAGIRTTFGPLMRRRKTASSCGKLIKLITNSPRPKHPQKAQKGCVVISNIHVNHPISLTIHCSWDVSSVPCYPDP